MLLPVHDLDVASVECRFHRLGGRTCLDLVATVGERWRRRFERLRTPEDLDRWLAVPTPWVDVPATTKDLEAARRLRHAIEVLVVDRTDEPVGQDARSDAVLTVNEFAAMPTPRRVLRTDGTMIVEPPDATGQVVAALGEVARDAVALFGSPAAERVRTCAADDCALVFLDTSRGRRRRWCSMQACGNRAKVARHRATTS